MGRRVVVLISGSGSNLQALLDAENLAGSVVGVVSDVATAGGLRRAQRARVATVVVDRKQHGDRAQWEEALADAVAQLSPDLIVLAGFMRILSGAFVRRWPILNVHPSLLPAFPGLRAIEQAVEHGVKVIGVTVHFVDEGVDSGPIVLQEPLDLPYPARIAEIEERVHGVEHRLLPRAVRLIAAGRVRPDPANPRAVLVDDGD